jgi:hypothetical protein
MAKRAMAQAVIRKRCIVNSSNTSDREPFAVALLVQSCDPRGRNAPYTTFYLAIGCIAFDI